MIQVETNPARSKNQVIIEAKRQAITDLMDSILIQAEDNGSIAPLFVKEIAEIELELLQSLGE